MQTSKIATLLYPVLAMAAAVLLLGSQAGCERQSAPAAGATTQTATQTAVQAEAPEPESSLHSSAAATETLRWQEGRDYVVLSPAQPVAPGLPQGRIEVLEMFWYGCPHCFSLEPYLQAWEPKKASYIHFTRVPVTWGPIHQLHARLFYALEELNRSDLHMAAFREIQAGDQLLTGRDVPETENLQVDFARRHGIDPDAYREVFNSSEVTEKVRHADELVRRYRADSIPFVFIHGRYATDAVHVGSQARLIELIDYLAAREHEGQ